MESFIDILITIGLMVLFTLVPSILARKKKLIPQPQPVPEEDIDEYAGMDDFLQESDVKVPKQEEYFTYETIDNNLEKNGQRQKIEFSNSSQVIENEIEEKGPLKLDADEIYKGVIYSEILKRKF